MNPTETFFFYNKYTKNIVIVLNKNRVVQTLVRAAIQLSMWFGVRPHYLLWGGVVVLNFHISDRNTKPIQYCVKTNPHFFIFCWVQEFIETCADIHKNTVYETKTEFVKFQLA